MLPHCAVRTIDGIRQKRLGGGGIIVSEIGLGTQRWGSADFNGPDEALCHKMMNRAILESGVNMIDTAEQYPIPSTPARPEGSTERIIGSWLAQDKSRRDKVVLASKITGGRNVNARNIAADLEGSLQRLGTNHLDLYLLHWPARYTPQASDTKGLLPGPAAPRLSPRSVPNRTSRAQHARRQRRRMLGHAVHGHHGGYGRARGSPVRSTCGSTLAARRATRRALRRPPVLRPIV